MRPPTSTSLPRATRREILGTGGLGLAYAAVLAGLVLAGAQAGAAARALLEQPREATAPVAVDPDVARARRGLERRLASDEQVRRWESSRAELLRAAMAHERAGRHREALYPLHAILEMFPSDEKALGTLGRCWLALGDPAKAVEFADRAAKADPRELVAFRTRAFAAAALGRLEEALADARHVMHVTPGDLEMRLFQAGLYERSGRRHHAIAAWERVIELAGSDADTLARARGRIRALAREILGEATGAEGSR